MTSSTPTLRLLDHSLLKALGGERFFLLETLREYARERLDEAAETPEYALRHARWYPERLQANYSDRHGPRRAEIYAWYEAEADNLRAMLDRLDGAALIEAAHAGYLLHVFWISLGAYTDEHERLRGLLLHGGLPDQARAELLVRLSDVSGKLGHLEVCEAADREALALAEPGTDPHWLAVVGLAFHAVHRGDTKEAVRLGRQALEEAERLDDVSRIYAISNLASILTGVNRTEEARSFLERSVREARRSGLVSMETSGLVDLGELDLLEHDYEAARAAYAAALTQIRSRAEKYNELETLRGLGLASLGLGLRGDARAAFAEMLELAVAATREHSAYVAGALSGIALAADPAAADRRRPAPRSGRPAQQRRRRRDECVPTSKGRARAPLRTPARSGARRGSVGAAKVRQ